MYVIQRTASITGQSGLQQVEDTTPLYVRRVEPDTRRGMKGSRRVRLTQDLSDAKTYATRAGAEAMASTLTGDHVTYVVKAV